MNPDHQNLIEERALTHVARLAAKGCADRDAIHRATVRHLIDQFGCTLLNARLVAARAIADHASQGLTARVDITKSTSTCIFVNVDGELRALALPDLVHALEHPSQAH